jgi:hypothetical protein
MCCIRCLKNTNLVVLKTAGISTFKLIFRRNVFSTLKMEVISPSEISTVLDPSRVSNVIVGHMVILLETPNVVV